MKKSQNVASTENLASTITNIEESAAAELNEVRKEIVAEATKAPETKVTAVEDRKYEPTNRTAARIFKGKQKQIVYNILLLSEVPLTISEVTPLAEAAGLVAKGGVEPSVRYHLHHLTKEGDTIVVNPTFLLT